METIGLIAGGGRFPILFAQSARRAGHRIVATGFVNQTAPELAGEVDALTWVKLGELGKVGAALQQGGATSVVMLGTVAKARFFRDAWLDGLGLQILAKLAVKTDDSVLRAIASALEERGLPVGDPTAFLQDRLAVEGVMGKRQPTEAQWADARYGLELARAIGRLDLGQILEAVDQIQCLFPARSLTEQKVNLLNLAGLQIQVELQSSARVQTGLHGPAQADAV